MQERKDTPDVFSQGIMPNIPRPVRRRQLRRNPFFTYLAFVGISLALLGSIAIGSLAG